MAVDIETIFAIRDAKGLKANEKVLLYTIESRGELYTSATRTAEDAGMSITTYYSVVRSLQEKGLISAKRSFGKDGGARPTRYLVNRAAIREMAQPGSTEEGDTAALDAPPSHAEETSARRLPDPAALGGPPVGNCRTTLQAAVEKEDPEDHLEKTTIKTTSKKNYKDTEDQVKGRRTVSDLERGLSGDNRLGAPSPGGSGRSAALGSGGSVSEFLQRTSPLNGEEAAVVVEVTVNHAGKLVGVDFTQDEEGQRQIHISGYEPMAKQDLRSALRNRPGLARDLILRLPEEDLLRALDLGHLSYQEERLRDELRQLTEIQ